MNYIRSLLKNTSEHDKLPILNADQYYGHCELLENSKLDVETELERISVVSDIFIGLNEEKLSARTKSESKQHTYLNWKYEDENGPWKYIYMIAVAFSQLFIHYTTLSIVLDITGPYYDAQTWVDVPFQWYFILCYAAFCAFVAFTWQRLVEGYLNIQYKISDAVVDLVYVIAPQLFIYHEVIRIGRNDLFDIPSIIPPVRKWDDIFVELFAIYVCVLFVYLTFIAHIWQYAAVKLLYKLRGNAVFLKFPYQYPQWDSSSIHRRCVMNRFVWFLSREALARPALPKLERSFKTGLRSSS
ncbi:hypothetical protein Ddc_02480 [Ditylenchus destructor]|nr:hypothetical protein Ddc_02480 [Ditylenchus destructor]